MSQDPIAAHLEGSRDAMQRAAADATLLTTAHAIAGAMIKALHAGHKVLLIGNGGSAADAQHIAAEIVGRYKHDRPGYAAIALTTDNSAMTSIANDYGFEQIFSRQVEALGAAGDVLLAFSTSGRSPNILAALRKAREIGIVTVGFTGTRGEAMRADCDHVLVAPSDDTPVIQQVYMAVTHGICDEVERAMVGAAKS